MLLLKFLLLLQGCFSLNLYCADSFCKECSSGYNYQSISCLPQCPTKFSLVASSCKTATKDFTLYSALFIYERDFSKSCIGVFCHPEGLSLSHQDRQSPITTIDRGLYFDRTSSLVSTPGWILAPDISFGMYVRIITAGIIFEATRSGSIIFQIKAVSPNILVDVLLNSSGGSQMCSLQTLFISGTWLAVRFSQTQAQSLVTLSFGGSDFRSEADLEFRTQDINMKYYFGSSPSGDSFIGFIYKATFLNGNSLEFTVRTIPNSCDYNTYSDICEPCDTSCSDWPWCTTANSKCILSTVSSCATSTGYTYSNCTSCSNNLTAPDCDLGIGCTDQLGSFDCTTCTAGLLKVKGLCVDNIYQYPGGSLLVVNIKFDVPSQWYGGIYQSGNNPINYSPDNSPDADDPVFHENKGLYFDGTGKFLQSSAIVSLSPANTVALWIHSINKNTVYYTTRFMIFGDLSVYYRLESSSSYAEFYTDSPSPPYNIWVFAVITVSHKSGVTTMKVSIQKNSYSSLTVDGYAFYDSEDYPVIGKNGDCFEGYLYTFSIWQNDNVDTSAIFTSCLPEPLWQVSKCNDTEYFSTYHGICLTCDASCTDGCTRWGTCQKCNNMMCNSCSDCSCTEDNHTPCLSPLIYSAGSCCSTNCGTCFGAYDMQCKTCNTGYYLLGTVCVTVCPNFYSHTNGVCIKSITNIISLIFNQIRDNYTDSTSQLIFTTGSNSSFYPDLQPSDPIPAKNRGYYFLSTSYMNSMQLSLNYNYSLKFWIKQKQPGILYTKGSVQFNTEMSFISSSFSFIKLGCINKTDWMLLTLKFTTDSLGTFTYYLHSSLYLYSIASGYKNSTMIPIDSSIITLGDASASFIGFLYRFDLIDYDPGILSFNYIVCSGLLNTGCLWNCDLAFFIETSGCEACKSVCTKGCTQSYHNCNLCYDLNCQICSGFEDKQCIECKQGYNFIENRCTACKGNTYYDSYVKNCVKCKNLCDSCLSAKVCTKCSDNSYMDSGNNCVCRPGFFYDSSGPSCIKCEDRCELCTAWKQCDKCISDSALDNTQNCVCKYGYYYAASVNECRKCKTLCLSCSEENVCGDCINNSHLDSKFQCVCLTGYFNDEEGNGCIECGDLCTDCSNENSCNTCISNSHLDMNSVCVCDVGYQEINNTCIISYFHVRYIISLSNNITLIFSEELAENLNAEDIVVTISGNRTGFTLQNIDSQTYKINLILTSELTTSQVLKISFNEQLISTSNSIMNANEISMALYYTPINTAAIEIQDAKALSTAGTAAAGSAAAGGSLINMNPSSFFTFINCMEIYTYVLLFDINFTSEFADFMKSSKPDLMIPNVFSYFISDLDGNPIPKKFQNLGYTSDLILLNSGPSISIILLFLFAMPIIFLCKHLSKGCVKKKLQWVAKLYKYAIFLRLLVQMFLELLVSSTIGVLNSKFETWVQITDLAICYSILGTTLIGGLGCVILIIYRGSVLNEENYFEKFGLLFEDSIDKETSQRLYYILFFMKRLFIGLVIFFISTPMLQLSLSVTMSLGTSLYLMCARPFKDKIAENYLICNEILTTTFFLILLASYLNDSGISMSYSNVICVRILFVSIGCNFTANVLSIFRSVVSCIRKRKKVTEAPTEINNESENGKPEDKFRNWFN